MEQFNLKIYKKAQEDLNDIVMYLNQFYTETAIQYYDLIIEKIGTLSTYPDRCAFVRDEALRFKGYRYLLINNYVVFFVIKNNIVQIRRIFYNKRQYKNIL